MTLLRKILHKTIILLQLILVVIFIVFEEIIWEGFAKPLYIFIHELHILQLLQVKLQSVNRYLILMLFVVLLVGVEIAGVTAGVMAVKGMLLSAMLLYALKLPIAAFTFWLFRATEKKLLSFGWLRWSYGKVVKLFSWIKSRDIYRNTISMAKELRRRVKNFVRMFGARYFSGEKRLSRRFARLYHYIKNVLK